jgi:iron-sulfur cluster insertion protein
MRFICFLGFTLCAAAVTMTLGCNESPDARRARSSAHSAKVMDESAAKADEVALVTVTPKAAETISRLIDDQRMTGKLCLRLRVVPGGCQGFMHKLDLDPDVSPEDFTCESAGVRVVVFKRQMEMVRGAEVDFGEVDGRQGFKIENPNFKGESAKRWLALLEKEKDVR